MNDEIYDVALRNALVGIKNATTDLNWSFILKKDGAVITGEENSVDPNMTKAASSLQSLAEKSGAIGGFDKMLINGDHGDVYVSNLNDMYLVAGLAKNADLAYFRTITSAIIPTILKVLESIASPLTPTPAPLKPTSLSSFSTTKPLPIKPLSPDLRIEKEPEEETGVEKEPEEEIGEEKEEVQETQKPEVSEIQESTHELQTETVETGTQIEDVPSQQFIVDRFSGLMVKADTVQLDADVLKRWTSILDVDEIKEVDIETFRGKTVRCKAKVINDSKLEGRGLIRIPEKTCQSLEVKRGELVRVKPVSLEEGD